MEYNRRLGSNAEAGVVFVLLVSSGCFGFRWVLLGTCYGVPVVRRGPVSLPACGVVGSHRCYEVCGV